MVMTLSAALYRAQTLAAQYAWHSPRLNGNSRDNTCGIWPYASYDDVNRVKSTRSWSHHVHKGAEGQPEHGKHDTSD